MSACLCLRNILNDYLPYHIVSFTSKGDGSDSAQVLVKNKTCHENKELLLGQIDKKQFFFKTL